MRRGRNFISFMFTFICISIFLFPLITLFTYSFEAPYQIIKYVDAIEDVRLNRIVPFRFAVHSFSLEQYYDVLIRQQKYLRLYSNSVIYSISITSIQVLLGSLVAFSISCFHVPYKNAIYFLYAILVLMPFQVLIVPNYFMLRWLNLINTSWALILPGIFGPYAVFLLRQYMITIPQSLIEATVIDGGNYWSAYCYVVMPVCKPAVVATCTLLFADMWNMVEQPLVLLQDKTLYPLSLALVDFVSARGRSDFAAIVLFMLPPLLLYMYYMDDLILGIQIGELK